jgi:photosystem II stability/assembly factor-like uncharacterized protein
MKNISLLALCLLLAGRIGAQLTYTGGPETFRVEQMQALGDTVIAISGDQVYWSSAKNTVQWTALSQGLNSKDSTIWDLRTFKGQFFLIQGNTRVFVLKPGADRWQDQSQGLQKGDEPDQLVSLENRELLLRCFNESFDDSYSWYQYDQLNRRWLPIARSMLYDQEPAWVILPNGNIQAYVAGDAINNQFRVQYDAQAKKWQLTDTISWPWFKSVIAFSNTELLAGSYIDGSVLRSTNGGKTWGFGGADQLPVDEGAVKFYKTNKVVYVLADEYLGRSLDKGRTWIDVVDFDFADADVPFYPTDSSFLMVFGGLLLGYEVSAELENAFIFQSKAPFYGLGAVELPLNILMYGYGGVAGLIEGSEEPAFAAINQGLPKVAGTTSVLKKAGTDLVAFSDLGFYSYNKTQGWQLSMNNGLEPLVPYLQGRGLATLKDTVILYDGFDATFLSPNRGKNWLKVGETPDQLGFQGMVQSKTQVFASFSFELYQWSGKTRTWNSLPHPEGNPFIFELAMKGDTLMVESRGKWYYSVSAGQQWKEMRTLPLDAVFFYSSEAGVYATDFSEDLVEIRAEGAHRVINGGPADEDLRNVIAKDSFVLALTTFNDGILYFSSNRGKTWKTVDVTKVGLVADALFDGDQVYLAGTNGVWVMPLRSLTTGVFELKPFAQANLKIWPNPSPDGQYMVELPEKETQGAVKIRVFNLQGQLVHNDQKQAWNGQLNLELANLPSGHYSLLVIDGQKAWSAKLIRQ